MDTSSDEVTAKRTTSSSISDEPAAKKIAIFLQDPLLVQSNTTQSAPRPIDITTFIFYDPRTRFDDTLPKITHYGFPEKSVLT